jgi:NitT/TauT family transport system ATP-binding protein
MRDNGHSRPKLAVEDATKFYDTQSGPLHALDRFSLDVRDGEFVCVVGPSGCGKTTLLWAMAGLHSLTDGRVLLDGDRVVGPHPQIGMVFQDAPTCCPGATCSATSSCRSRSSTSALMQSASPTCSTGSD